MAVVDLAPQPLDVDLDQVRHRVEAVVPDMLGDVRAADDGTLAPRKVLEQRVLLRRELNGTFAALDTARPCVDGEILDLQGPVLRVTGYDVPYPYWQIEDAYMPSVERVVDAVRRVLAA